MQVGNFLEGLPDNPPNLVTLGQDNFARGVITLVDESKLPKNALKEADNITLAEDGAPKVRPGVNWYGTAPSANTIDGAAMYVASDETVHLVVVAGGNFYRSLDDGTTWATCTGATFTAGKKVDSELANTHLYLFNGWDNIVRYDGTTTLQVYTPLTTPNATSLTKTGLAGTQIYTFRYRVSAVNAVGYSIASTALTITTDRTRDTFDASNYLTFSWTPVVGAVRYDIYTGQTAGEENYIDSVDGQASGTYIDKGAAIEQTSITAPTENTSQGPRVGDMAMVGSRLYATADRDNQYRVWIGGAGRFLGQFANNENSTYIDLQKGGQFRPVKVEDYRDGKGTPLATVWCRSKDGRGAIWQGTLETFTIGDISFPVPNFYRLPGSRGTDAPHSVINVLNDYYYYNEQAFYNLGSRAQFLNLLSTDEASANIRPNMKQIRQSAAHKIAAHFQDAKIYFSVPYAADENNATIIFDTERKAWLPRAFTIGFERFFTYSDTTNAKHMLCWKAGDTRLSEVGEDINGDYGVPFTTSLITGLMHVNPKNRFEFLWCEEGEVEFAQPQGTISIELSGITREDGFRQIGVKTIQPISVKRSWTTARWTTHRWTATDLVIVSYSEPSMKRYFNVQEDINAYQYRIETVALNSDYILRTLQINGTGTQTGKPRSWELYD